MLCVTCFHCKNVPGAKFGAQWLKVENVIEIAKLFQQGWHHDLISLLLSPNISVLKYRSKMQKTNIKLYLYFEGALQLKQILISAEFLVVNILKISGSYLHGRAFVVSETQKIYNLHGLVVLWKSLGVRIRIENNFQIPRKKFRCTHSSCK